MTGVDCVVMYTLINTHTHIHIRRQEKVGSVAADLDNIGDNKEAGTEAQGTEGLNMNCTSRERVSRLSRLIRGFRSQYY